MTASITSVSASAHTTPHVTIIHENDDWVAPLRAALQELGTPFTEWHLGEGIVDLTSTPPDGIFYNRMSASSHTRGHRYAPELAAATLAWLTQHGRRVVNGERALQLELSKVAQYQSLAAHDVETPSTIAAVGRDNILAAARTLGFPLITKHNRAGKGLGVALFYDHESLIAHLDAPDFEAPVDGIMLVQRYISAPKSYITRVEFVGGKLLYAVRVDTSDGFELCPADACELPIADVCPADTPSEKFAIQTGFAHPLVPQWEAVLAANDIQVAGIEFIVDEQGNAFTYDINTNTNYNAQAEEKAGVSGMKSLAAYLTELLEECYPAQRAAVAA